MSEAFVSVQRSTDNNAGIPLMFDVFFESMAVTIIFGLGFASVLTLVVLPVTYSLLYRIRFDGTNPAYP